LKPSEFHQSLIDNFPFTPTVSQSECLTKLTEFLFETNTNSLFVLKGFAGTGKTTLVGTLIKKLWQIKMKYVLLAPTGRAAKVLANYADAKAQTIHKHIYYPSKETGGKVTYTLKPNKSKNTLYIVDESSMITDNSVHTGKLFERGSVLEDLLSFVYANEGCRLIFIGDTAQLPPINSELSPALDPEILKQNFPLETHDHELNEVVRQAAKSGLLTNATQLRKSIQSKEPSFKFQLDSFTDIKPLEDSEAIVDSLENAYATYGHQGTVIIVRSNKRANLYNKHIRARILDKETELAIGDYLMVVKNNYYWLDQKSEAGFIANGDLIEILEIHAFRELYGFKFAEVHIRFADYPNMPTLDTVLILDTLDLDSPSLNYEQQQRLYREIEKDFPEIRSKQARYLKIKSSPFYNALQIKYAYAITCHKSQGGQWPQVFIEQPYLKEGKNIDYLRWLYTAITRSQKEVFLIGFDESHF